VPAEREEVAVQLGDVDGAVGNELRPVNEDAIAIRAGHHCNQLVMRRYGVPATARASFYLYNTRDEVDALIDSLAKAEGVFNF